jgi:hypothetical protein
MEATIIPIKGPRRIRLKLRSRSSRDNKSQRGVTEGPFVSFQMSQFFLATIFDGTKSALIQSRRETSHGPFRGFKSIDCSSQAF